MKYLEFQFTLTPADVDAEDVLSAVLAEIGFDSFVRSNELDVPRARPEEHAADPEAPEFDAPAERGQYCAYIQQALFSPQALQEALEAFPFPHVHIEYCMQEAEDRDWNAEWEKNYFQPLVVDGRCCVASTFHENPPRAEYNIFINPQMSFGTGHHATTSQMISRLLQTDVEGLRVLDMGCGTSILGILARMRGAKEVVGVDVDEWCVKNSQENIALNHLDAIQVLLGSAASLPELGRFDLILANINRNILLADLPAYVAALAEGGVIFMSGFYEEDVPVLATRAEELGLSLHDVMTRDGWACIAIK